MMVPRRQTHGAWVMSPVWIMNAGLDGIGPSRQCIVAPSFSVAFGSA